MPPGPAPSCAAGRLLVGALLVVAVLAGACGGDGASSESASGTGGGLVENDLPPAAGPFAEGRTQVPGFGEVEVRIVPGPDGEPIVLCVLLAATPEQRQRGLMQIDDPTLGGYDGMLFTFDGERDGGFWMKDTLLPLSIAYLDAEGATVDALDMDPCPPGTECPSYPSSAPYLQALEVPQGGLEPLGLAPGSDARLEVAGGCRDA